MAPGYSLSGGDATLAASEHDHSAAPRSWTFAFEVAAPTTATVSARCLHTTVGAVLGHTHELRFTEVVRTVTVSGHTVAEGDELQVACPEDAKGVVATWDLPAGVRSLGNDPRLKARAFRLHNATGTAKTATIDLLCLRDRTTTEDMGTSDPVSIDNTVIVGSASADADGTNNSSTATVTVQPGTATAAVVGRAAATTSSLALRVVSAMPGRGAVTVRSGAVVLARGVVTFRAGASATARPPLTPAGLRRIGRLHRVRVTVDPTRGPTTSATLPVAPVRPAGHARAGSRGVPLRS